jgi:multisubunit Na+/H+ antiporter MnhB subunit
MTCALVAVGLWLGGYPGAVILPVATLAFLMATGYRGSPSPSGLRRFWLELLRPRALAALLLLASVCSAVGEHLVQAGTSGLATTALVNAIPQVICLIIVGRLVAALIIP